MRAAPLAILAAVAIAGTAHAAPRSPAERDAESYAVATCLTLQPQVTLKAQGNGYGSIILDRARAGVEELAPIVAAVRAEATRAPMYQVKAETVAEGSHPMPIGYCADIIDRPAVRTAIDRTVARIAPAYRRR